MNIIDNFESLLFCFHTFGIRRSIDVLDSKNQLRSGSGKILTGSGAYRGRLTPEVWIQKRRLPRLSKIFIQTNLKISLRLRYRAIYPVLGQNRILTPGYIFPVYKRDIRNYITQMFNLSVGSV